jgi:mycothiol synthase
MDAERTKTEYDLLSSASVERSIFADPDPQAVLGVYDGGLEAVGAAVVRGERGFVKFLAVHPRERRRGIGSALLQRLEGFCAEHGAASVDIGTSAPYYVVPGVDVRTTELVCLLEDAGYQRCGEAVNLSVRLHALPGPPDGIRIAGPDDLEALRPWVAQTYPAWIDELERGVAARTCVVVGDVGFACFDVNRDGWFGPIATHPDVQGRGRGRATLLGALDLMRRRGHERAEIAWAAALGFYLKTVGARVSRVFWWYRKDLA